MLIVMTSTSLLPYPVPAPSLTPMVAKNGQSNVYCFSKIDQKRAGYQSADYGVSRQVDIRQLVYQENASPFPVVLF